MTVITVIKIFSPCKILSYIHSFIDIRIFPIFKTLDSDNNFHIVN